MRRLLLLREMFSVCVCIWTPNKIIHERARPACNPETSFKFRVYIYERKQSATSVENATRTIFDVVLSQSALLVFILIWSRSVSTCQSHYKPTDILRNLFHPSLSCRCVTLLPSRRRCRLPAFPSQACKGITIA